MEVIRVDRLRSREHFSAIAVAAAVHLGRVRFPCASSATLGNSTERVNGRQALERRSLPPTFLSFLFQEPIIAYITKKRLRN